MAGETPSRFERLEQALQDRILEAALMEFGRFGYSSASMNRLVRNAGISKGALFKYFGTKAGLFEYLYRSILEEVKEKLRTVREESRTQPFFSRLEKVIRTGLEFTEGRPFSASIYFRSVYTGDAPDGMGILSEIQDASRHFLGALIEDGIRKGELRENIDTQKSAFIIQSVLDRFLQAHYLQYLHRSAKRPAEDGYPGLFSDSGKWIREIIGFFRDGLDIRTGKKE